MKESGVWHIGVAIPARNEEELLPRCLRSVLVAKDNVAHSATVDVVVVADSSVDDTARIATNLLRSSGTVRTISAGAVGEARRVATQILMERYHGPLRQCWLANTDADCVVPPSWLADQLSLALSGVQAVAGTVSVDTFKEHGSEVPDRFRASYLIASDGSHPHVHGANLGVRADCYLGAGGWGDLSTAEDHDLWQRLSLTGVRKLSTSRIQVQTSGRRVGRAPDGFASALAAHNETAA